MSSNIEYWEKIYYNARNNKVKYDLWLEKFLDIIETSRDNKIIDLGCGCGNNSLYLTQKGYEVIACDYSSGALKIVEKNIEGIEVLNVDLTRKLPFKDNMADVIIADLCLHYFDEITTAKIIKEIIRVLKVNGHIFFRVNSVNDINYGSDSKEEIEKHYYKTKAGNKRFFDENDIRYFFKDMEICYLKETTMNRYGNDKKCFEVVCRKYKRDIV